MVVTEFPTTLQGWFDNAWQWAVVEKHPPSILPVVSGKAAVCRYRNDDGNRCLIGASIPDHLYGGGMESRSAHVALRFYLTGTSFLIILDALQSCHDKRSHGPTNSYDGSQLRAVHSGASGEDQCGDTPRRGTQMSAQQITKSDTILRSYSEAREIDQVALPLIPEHGIQRAYQIAFDAKQGK